MDSALAHAPPRRRILARLLMRAAAALAVTAAVAFALTFDGTRKEMRMTASGGEVAR